jgi:hypothetical protein
MLRNAYSKEAGAPEYPAFQNLVEFDLGEVKSNIFGSFNGAFYDEQV